MDRTSWVVVIICVTLLIFLGNRSIKDAARLAEERKAAEIAKQEEVAKNPPANTANKSSATTSSDIPAPAPSKPAVEAIAESKTILANEFVRFHLTNKGAGIQTTELLKHNRRLNDESEKVTLNETSKHPVGIFSTGPGQFDPLVWTVKSQDKTSVTYQVDTPEKLHIEKTFSLPGEGADPYEIGLEISIRNISEAPAQPGKKFLYTGTSAPLHLQESPMLGGFYWMDDNDYTFKMTTHFSGGMFGKMFGKGKIPHDEFFITSLAWAGVNDQYYTTLIKPETPYKASIWASRFPVVIDGDKEMSEKKRLFAVESAFELPESDLAMNPNDQKTLRYRIYMGPKELTRLKTFGDKRKQVMNYDKIPIFGFLFGWAIKPIASGLITALVFMQGKLGSFGGAIILVTVMIRLLIWPVYAKSARSMKRMSKLTPLMKKLKEKHADDPQKMNQETMALYKKYGVNPLGGCLPMFIQMPVFLSFYRMLWSAVDLRHESFLWVDDLAMPDTLFQIPGLDLPFNLLPILMALTTFVQMAITPQTGDKTQRMIFMLMPFMFLFICYNFASALSLYWTTSNLFSILQTWMTNKMPEPELKETKNSGKKGFMQRMQEQAETQQKAKKSGGSAPPTPGQSRTKMPGEKGNRHTKSKKNKKR